MLSPPAFQLGEMVMFRKHVKKSTVNWHACEKERLCTFSHVYVRVCACICLYLKLILDQNVQEIAYLPLQ